MPCVYFGQTRPKDTPGWYRGRRGGGKLKARNCGLMVEVADLEAVDTRKTAKAQSLTHRR